MSCPSSKPWQCINGDCKSSYLDCRSTNSKCSGMNDYPYYCGYFNGDTCVEDDVYCMRPCGTKMRRFTFDAKCSSFPGKCAWLSTDCPVKCKPGEIRCPNSRSRKCAINKEFCEPCYRGFRCQNTGKCINDYKKCDGVNDCGDGSDERGCTSVGPDRDVDTDFNTFPIVIGVGVSVSVFVVILVVLMVYCMRRKRGHASRGVVIGRNQPNTAGEPMIAGARPVQNVPQLSGVGPQPYGAGANLWASAPNPQVQGGFAMAAGGSSTNLNTGLPASAPPPSYNEVLVNESQYKKTDAELPSYGESSHIPPVNPSSYT